MSKGFLERDANFKGGNGSTRWSVGGTHSGNERKKPLGKKFSMTKYEILKILAAGKLGDADVPSSC